MQIIFIVSHYTFFNIFVFDTCINYVNILRNRRQQVKVFLLPGSCMGKDELSTVDNRQFFNCLVLIKNYLSIRFAHFWLHFDFVCRFQKTYHVIESHKKTLFGILEQVTISNYYVSLYPTP